MGLHTNGSSHTNMRAHQWERERKTRANKKVLCVHVALIKYTKDIIHTEGASGAPRVLQGVSTPPIGTRDIVSTDTEVFVQPIFSSFSVQNPDICAPTENHDPSTVLDSVGISGSGISVVLHSWCFHHFLYNKTEFGSATASPEIARADPEIIDS